jgi:protein-S-isoprenylcysteine O-methyltransferase Ste14
MSSGRPGAHSVLAGLLLRRNLRLLVRHRRGWAMTSGTAGVAQSSDPGARWPATMASLIVGAAFFALWFWLLPGLLGFRMDTPAATGWRWVAALPSVLGFAVALRCIWDFGWTGHGTPAPMAPPKKLVVVGFYRYVRNPMYVGFFVGWAGLWAVFGRANLAAIAIACAALACVALFVRFYEEPTLRGKFGMEYTDYCKHVRRWMPRLRPWRPGL